MMIEQGQFDYAALDVDTRAFVQEKARAIHTRLKRTAEDVIAIGLDLLEVKNKLGHGQFIGWLNSEFDLTRQSAANFMRVAERFGKSECKTVLHLPIRILYELSSPSTPETVIDMVETGVVPPALSAIREAKRDSQQQRPAITDPGELPSTFGLVNGAPFTLPLPDGHPVEIPEDWKLPPKLRGETPIKSPALSALQSSDSNEWYTPAQYVEAARELMGGIDVDPASNELANQVIQAERYYTRRDNGLFQPWRGRVWLNPPYGFDNGVSNQEVWTRQLIERFTAGLVSEAVLLVNANTEAKWFQPLYDYLICFTNHRIRFYNADGDSSQPTQGNALVYFGRQDQRFLALFGRFGTVVRRAEG